MAQYEAAKTENLRQLEGLTDWLSVRQFRIFLPPQPLASLVGGVSNDIGRTTEVRGRGELSATDSRYSEDPLFATFRFLDLDFTFQIVLSLLAILFAFDSVNGEKERGTLRLALANAVPRHLFITGKLIGSFLGLIVPLLLPIALGASDVTLMDMVCAYSTFASGTQVKPVFYEWVMNKDGSGQRRLLDSPYNDWDPIWVK